MPNNCNDSVTVKFFQKEIIDFNSDLSVLGDRQLKLVNKPSHIYIPDKKMVFMKIAFIKKPKGMLHYVIEISDLGNLKLKEGEDLLKCSFCGNPTYSAQGDFEADGKKNEFPIQFCLCPSAIKDYGEVLDKDTECTVTFSITITGEKCFNPHIEYGEIKLKILRVQPYVSFDYEDIIKEMTYTINKEPYRIGTLVVKHSSNLQCAPSISATFPLHTLIKKGENQDEEVFVDYPTMVYGLEAGNHHRSCTVTTRSELSIDDLKSGDKFKVPVFWYMNEVMANPEKSEDVFKLQLKNSGNRPPLDKSRFILKRNHCLTRLAAILSAQAQIWDILAIETAPETCSMKLNVGAKLNHNLVFRNTADAHPGVNVHSCVKVWGVKISVEYGNEAASKRLKLQEGKTIKDVVSLHNTLSQKLVSEGEYVDLDPQGQWDMNIRFDSQYIKWIDPDPNEFETWIPIKVTLSYNYIEDSNGRTYRHEPKSLDEKSSLMAHKRTFTYEIHLTAISTSPLLCVDFGTSAIVAASAIFDRGNLTLDLINLSERKSALLNAAFPDKKSNKDEEGVLINSVLCLNPAPDMGHAFDSVTGNDTDFNKYTYLLSPGDDLLSADYMAPNLKLLMGYDKIPNIFSVIQQTYKYAVQEGVDDKCFPIIQPHSIIENGCSTELMSLEKIVKIVYLQLFKHYLRTTADNTQLRIERLVMTVPNTYTPLQLDFIRRIAREALPELRPEEFHLVSESDAVACYYLYKREVLLKQMKEDNPSIYNNDERRVLIYDMGAGTLDLTLMHTTQKQEHDSLNVRMLGKLGVSKAGNYLDYVLGQILVDAVQERGTSIQILGSNETIRKLGAKHLANLIKIDTEGGLGSSKERLALKTYIKEMKKQLNSDGETLLNNLPEDNEIAKWASNAGVTYNFSALKVKDIRKHDLFTEYIRSVTTNLLKDFEMYVCQTNPEFELQDIDVVVFSGRSTQLMDIRRNVKEALKQNPHIYYVDLINETSSTAIDKIIGQGGQSTKLKTVVAEGAYHSVNFMDCNKDIKLDTRKIFASFGLVQYNRTQEGQRIWTPLIQAQIPCKGEDIEVDECQSYIKVTREIDVNGNRYIDLIQSYCGDVAGCDNFSSNETINVLAPIVLPENTKKAKVEFTLYIEPVNGMAKSIHLKINDQEYDVNPHVDIQRNIALRRSLWPVVFS